MRNSPFPYSYYRKGRYESKIGIPGHRVKHLGTFSSAYEAHKAAVFFYTLTVGKHPPNSLLKGEHRA